MTQPVNGQQPQVPLFDPGNPPVDVNAMLVTQVVNTPGGQRLAATVRIPNTTVTVLLAKDDALRWADEIQKATARMTGLILP